MFDFGHLDKFDCSLIGILVWALGFFLSYGLKINSIYLKQGWERELSIDELINIIVWPVALPARIAIDIFHFLRR